MSGVSYSFTVHAFVVILLGRTQPEFVPSDGRENTLACPEPQRCSLKSSRNIGRYKVHSAKSEAIASSAASTDVPDTSLFSWATA
uniref:Uncharacterized protein n=1 Tax=Sphaerodactylus townsendi TaxID=933632 RepID=A0ACB8ET07_9SAUR